jgi:tripartite-type tricarboxylate transporter receptor subunit TctC
MGTVIYSLLRDGSKKRSTETPLDADQTNPSCRQDAEVREGRHNQGNSMNERVTKTILSLVVLFVSGAPSQAADYPSKPIRAIVPFAPGGGVDIAARSVGQKLSERWKQQVIIDNRSGANGNIGAEIASHAPADGYTLLLGSTGPMAINPSLYAKLPFDPVKDFSPVVMVAPTYYVLVTHPSVPANSLADIVRVAKTGTYRLTLASAGIGSPGHLSGEMLKMMAGIDFVHVPYKGTGPALADVVGGHASMIFTDLIAGLSYIQAGRLKAIAVATPRRLPKLATTPTLSESGVPGYDAMAWTGMFVPAGTSKAIVDKLNSEVRDILRIPEVQERIAAAGNDFGSNTPQYVATYLNSEIAKWAKVIKASGATAE